MPAAEQSRWSWRIAEVAGFGLYVHASFVVLLA
jgi:hypothetical protein